MCSFFNTGKKKNRFEAYKKRRPCLFSNIWPWHFRLLCLQKLIILFPPARYDFNNSVPLNAFASKAATNAVIVGHFGKDLEFFIDCAFRESVLPFSALPKLINALPFYPRNSGSVAFWGGLSMGMSFLWESHGKRPVEWDRHKLLWDGNGTDKYVPWTTLVVCLPNLMPLLSRHLSWPKKVRADRFYFESV